MKPIDETMKRTPSASSGGSSLNTKLDLNKTDLLRLLAYLEGELQARDVAIATLKVLLNSNHRMQKNFLQMEKAKALMYQAKYGRLAINDPYAALQRDSDALAGTSGDFDEKQVAAVYDNQLASLDRLIQAQHDAHERAKQVDFVDERVKKELWCRCSLRANEDIVQRCENWNRRGKEPPLTARKEMMCARC